MTLMPVSELEADVRRFMSSLRQRGLTIELHPDKPDTIVVKPHGYITPVNRSYIFDVKPIILAVLRLEQAVRDREPSGYVYVLQAGKYVKIGKTENLENRIKQLKIQLPFEVELIHVIECVNHHEVENDLHEQFRAYRTNGEWFTLSPEQIAELQQVERL